jgi:hypothetical protein
MSDFHLDHDTAELLLRGEAAGSPELVGLLAAASAELAAEDLGGEEAAVAAFREARSHRAPRPTTWRLSALVSVRAALVGLVLVLAGGVTAVAATTSQHLPGPLGDRHSHRSHAPATSRPIVTRVPSPVPSRRAPGLAPVPSKNPPGKPAEPKRHPRPPKKPKLKPPTNPPKNPPGLRGKSPHGTPPNK